jgi:SAM-dependent methyltransferase
MIAQVLAKIASKLRHRGVTKFKESKLAHRYCVGCGIEIGGSAHNPFGLNTRNVDFTREMTPYKQEEIRMCGEFLRVDIEAPGDRLPLPDSSEDFVVSSHALEHFMDPINALLEWYRVIKPGGIIFVIAPHKERTFDAPRPRTTLQELIDRHAGRILLEDTHEHLSVWITEDLVELVEYMNSAHVFPSPVKIECVQDTDDKVGNGFTVVLRKPL